MQGTPGQNEFIHIKDLVKQPALFTTKQDKENSSISRRSFYNYLGKLAPASVNPLGVGGMLSQSEIQSQIVKERSELFTQMTGKKLTEVGNYKFKRSQDWVGAFLCGKPIKKIVEYEKKEPTKEINDSKSHKDTKLGSKKSKSVKIQDTSLNSRNSTPSKPNLSTSRSKHSTKTATSNISKTKSAGKVNTSTRSASDSKSPKKTPGMPRRRLKSKLSAEKTPSPKTAQKTERKSPKSQTGKNKNAAGRGKNVGDGVAIPPKNSKLNAADVGKMNDKKSSKKNPHKKNNSKSSRSESKIKDKSKLKDTAAVSKGTKRDVSGNSVKTDKLSEKPSGKENIQKRASAGAAATKSTAPVKKRSPGPVVDRSLLFLQRNPDKSVSRKKFGLIKTPVKNAAAEEKMIKAAAKLC